MAGRRNKNDFKFVLQLLKLSQKQILGVKNVVWGGLEVGWGGLGCFHGPGKTKQSLLEGRTKWSLSETSNLI